MSRIARDVWLACLSALMTSFTIQIREWTGIRRSDEWPIGAAILLMIAFQIAQRKEGVRTGLLLASLIGIGLGLSVSSVVYELALGKSLGPALFLIVGTVACAWMYIRNDKREREAADRAAKLDRRFDAILRLPPKEAAEAIRAELSSAGRSIDRAIRNLGVVIAIAMLLNLVYLPFAIVPEVKPLEVLLDLALLGGGFVWFGRLAIAKRARRQSPASPPREPN